MWIIAGIGGAIGGAILLGYFFYWNVIAIIIGVVLGGLLGIGKAIAPPTPPTYEEMEESNRRDRIREEYNKRHPYNM